MSSDMAIAGHVKWKGGFDYRNQGSVRSKIPGGD